MNIVVDSGCDSSAELEKLHALKLTRVPLSLQLDGKDYIDNEDLNVASYVENMGKAAGAARTAAPAPHHFFEKFKREGSVFCVTLSSKLSASYSNAVLAKNMYLDEIGNKFIHVFDSFSASVAETVIAVKINEMIKAKLSENEIVEKVNSYISNLRTYFILDKYDNLVKNGRVSPYMAKLASFLSIRPIGIARDGEIAMCGKSRGYNNAVAKLLDIIGADKTDLSTRTLGISHVRAVEKANEFKKQVLKRFNFKEVFIVDASGLVATYADKSGIIISY